MNEQKTEVELLYEVLDETAEVLQKELSLPYLEALAETGENLFQGNVLQSLDDINQKRLLNAYDSIKIDKLNPEQIRKSLQLAILKGMKEATQPHHEMTPDAVSLFVGYLVNKLMTKQEDFSIFDPAVGTGNLLTAILNQTQKKVQAYGMEVDDTLLKLMYVQANLQKHPIELYKQDSLQPGLLKLMDVIACDLPIGYYPNDVVANEYELKADEGHSYAHHLFIEKGIRQTKPGGFLVLLIPNVIFEGEEAKKLNEYIKEHAVIQGLLQLPLSMFKKEQFAKSIFILQKKGENVKVPKQALLAELPSFSKKEAMQGMVERINNWIKTEILS